jgi:hypothetical protein
VLEEGGELFGATLFLGTALRYLAILGPAPVEVAD